MKIAIFYHCLFELGSPPEVRDLALEIVREQMMQLQQSGLCSEAETFLVGINGGAESRALAHVLIPAKAKLVMHGLASRTENLTLVQIEQWLPKHPGWAVLYFHAKGASHLDLAKIKYSARWRNCMMHHLVTDWRKCLQDLEAGFESVGCHWMTGAATPPGQSIWAGNFWWATSDFLRTVPSIFERDRIKISGIASLESRYEAEVWLGNAPRLPRIKDYHGPNWNPGMVGTCLAR